MTVEMISHLLEALMILCFGLSWPLSIYKSWTSRTAKGKSLYFEVFIWIGYIFGIANKFISYMNNPDKDWIFFLAWAFYFLNIAEITVDMVLYFRNVKLDKKREAWAGILTFVLSFLTISKIGCMVGRSFDIMGVSETKAKNRKGGFL